MGDPFCRLDLGPQVFFNGHYPFFKSCEISGLAQNSSLSFRGRELAIIRNSAGGTGSERSNHWSAFQSQRWSCYLTQEILLHFLCFFYCILSHSCKCMHILHMYVSSSRWFSIYLGEEADKGVIPFQARQVETGDV